MKDIRKARSATSVFRSIRCFCSLPFHSIIAFIASILLTSLFVYDQRLSVKTRHTSSIGQNSIENFCSPKYAEGSGESDCGQEFGLDLREGYEGRRVKAVLRFFGDELACGIEFEWWLSGKVPCESRESILTPK